jgi:hypothetical protein
MSNVTHHPGARAFVLTAAALIAFASNSILCRLALSRGEIDPATFTTIRLVSGAAALAALAAWLGAAAFQRRRGGPSPAGG